MIIVIITIMKKMSNIFEFKTLENKDLVFTKQSSIIASTKSIHKELVKLINSTL